MTYVKRTKREEQVGKGGGGNGARKNVEMREKRKRERENNGETGKGTDRQTNGGHREKYK